MGQTFPAKGRGRPSRAYEKRSIQIFNDAINDTRFRELVLHAFMGGRGYKPVFNSDGSFKRYEVDEQSTPVSRRAYQQMIFEYKMGKPVSNITIEESSDAFTFDEFMRSMGREKLQGIVAQAEELIKAKKVDNDEGE